MAGKVLPIRSQNCCVSEGKKEREEKVRGKMGEGDRSRRERKGAIKIRLLDILAVILWRGRDGRAGGEGRLKRI